MCSASSARSSAVWSPRSSGTCSSADAAGHRAQREHDGHADPDRDRGDQVDRHRDREREHQDDGVAAGGPGERAAASRPRPSGRWWRAARRPARRAGCGRPAAPAAETITASATAWVSAASLRRGPGAHVHRRAGDRRGGRDRRRRRGAARLARPCPNSSRSGSWRWPTLIPSATVADSRLSSAASAATASAEGSRARHGAEVDEADSDGAGSPAGRSPMRASVERSRARRAPWRRPPRAARTARRGRHRAPSEHHRRDAERHHERRRLRRLDEAGRPRRRRPPRPGPRPRRDAERGRDLLQGDHHRDAGGEALDTGAGR